MPALSATELLTTEVWRSWSPERKRHLLARAQEERARRMQAARTPYPWQRPHDHPAGFPLGPGGTCTAACAELPTLQVPTHHTYALLGGRGIGKTDAGSMYVLDHLRGPVCDRRVRGGHRLAIVAPTLGDAVESCVRGVSGLQAYDPRVTVGSSSGGTYVRFPSGATAKLFGGSTPDDVNRLRSGGNRCLVWLEEAAAIRQLDGVLEHARLGLRVGPRPHFIATTTPKAIATVKAWQHDPRVHLTRGRTADATHLDAAVREALADLYGGTRLGAQELDGLVLEDVEGALWKQALIDRTRVALVDVPLAKIVVGVDPNAGGDDEVGIVVVGLTQHRYPDSLGRMVPHLYVLEDASGPYSSPAAWARRVVQAYHRWDAREVVAEVNNGGDMVPYTLATVDPSLRCEVVHATRGKALRAEPVVALYERDSVHHVGAHPRLEEQMTSWVEGVAPGSPDRMDALVWAATRLGVRTGGGSVSVA